MWLLGPIMAIALGVVVYDTLPLLYPKALMLAPMDPACDLRAGPCTARFASGGIVRFGIAPRDIPVLKPLRLEIELEDLEPKGVEVDFAGTDMNMGYNRVHLERVATDRYLGEGMLPVCVRNRMTWEAKVMVETSEGYLVAPFRFHTFRSPPPDS